MNSTLILLINVKSWDLRIEIKDANPIIKK